MKLFPLYIILFAVLVGGWAEHVFSQNIGEEEVPRSIVDNVILPYIVALKQGDVVALERLLDDDMAVTLNKLLTQNTQYPEFLRKRFGQLTIPLSLDDLKVRMSEGEKTVPLTIPLRGGQIFHDEGAGRSTSESNNQIINLNLTLRKTNSGEWKIANQTFLQPGVDPRHDGE